MDRFSSKFLYIYFSDCSDYISSERMICLKEQKEIFHNICYYSLIITLSRVFQYISSLSSHNYLPVL